MLGFLNFYFIICSVPFLVFGYILFTPQYHNTYFYILVCSTRVT